MIKKIIVTVFCIFAFSFSVSALSADDISAKSAVIINSETYETVFEKNARDRRSMASTTKIMTAVLASQSGKLEQTVEITPSMCGAEGTSIGLKAGYKIRLYDLVCGMMLESGNDAANAVAIFLAGDIVSFSKLMNKKASEIGMESTNFVTPSGLDDENHYTTAYDMALLGIYAMKDPVLREICSFKTARCEYEKPDICVTFSNHNRLLRSYDGVYGIKTGFTKKSGRCLVSAVERDGVSFVAVTLNAPDDWNDHIKMFNYSFEISQKRDFSSDIPDKVSVIGSDTKYIKLKTEKSQLAFANSSTKVSVKVYLPRFVYAPVSEGDTIGFYEVYVNSIKCAEVCITAGTSCKTQEETYVRKKTLMQYIREHLRLQP